MIFIAYKKLLNYFTTPVYSTISNFTQPTGALTQARYKKHINCLYLFFNK